MDCRSYKSSCTTESNPARAPANNNFGHDVDDKILGPAMVDDNFGPGRQQHRLRQRLLTPSDDEAEAKAERLTRTRRRSAKGGRS
jgi:hypothetical protein